MSHTVLDSDGIEYKEKTPDEVLDYIVDWAAATNNVPGASDNWLAVSESIASIDVSSDTGINIDSSSITDSSTSVTLWLSGGTAGTNYDIAVKVTTSSGRVAVRTIRIKVISKR